MHPSRRGICGTCRMRPRRRRLYNGGMSFEDHILRKVDDDRRRERRAHQDALHTRLELPPVIKEAHDRAKREIFSNREYAVQAPEFTKVYGEDNVRNDMAEVYRLKNIFKKQETPEKKNSQIQAEVLEGILLMHSELSNWLGDAHTMKTSLYDDYKNKTDMFAEWYSPEEGSRVLALGVDATFSRMAVENKLHQIKREIDAGELGKIRYFKDSRGDFMGTRNNVPRVIIGVRPQAVEELATLWMNNDNKALAAHPVQHLIVSEIHTQLSAMLVYAKKRSMVEPARAYQQALNVVEKLKHEKSSMSSDQFADDVVAKQILAESKRIFE